MNKYLPKPEDEKRKLEKEANKTSWLPLSLGAFGLIASMFPVIGGMSGFEAGFGAAASIGILINGIYLKDIESDARRKLKVLRDLENLKNKD
jgi:hypothetical protein